MEIDDLIESLQIIQHYLPNVDIQPEHDVFIVFCDADDVAAFSAEDQERLTKLGWESDEYGGFVRRV